MSATSHGCMLTEGPSGGLRVGSVHFACGHVVDDGWPSITVVDAFGNEAHYSLGITNQERSGHKKEVARLKELARSAEKLRDDAREDLLAAKSKVSEAKKDAVAMTEQNKLLQADIETMLKRSKESNALAKSWKAKADYRDKKIAELRDALDQERTKPLTRLVRERAELGFKRLIASLKGYA